MPGMGDNGKFLGAPVPAPGTFVPPPPIGSESGLAGLSPTQMQMMGLTDEQIAKKLIHDPFSITAKASYGNEMPSMRNPPTRQAVTMSAGGGGYGHNPNSAPPDLPSLLCHSRILFLGMPLVPSVTELMIAQLLYMNYDNAQKPVYMYINSSGSQNERGEPVALDSEAFAILDTMQYVDAEIQTVCITKAYGNAMMLLAGGEPGKRFTLPNASLMTTPPRVGRQQATVTDLCVSSQELDRTTTLYMDYMSEFTGKSVETLKEDFARPRYYTAEEAIEYGLIDKVVPQMKGAKVNYDAMVQNASARAGGGAPAAAGAM